MIRAPRRLSRGGFTILELLIVMAIIMLLIALTAGAAMRYSDVQRKRNTEVTLQKLDTLLLQQWNAAVAKANNDPIPAAISTMAGGNDQLSRVIYIKYCMIQQFPMTFSEATAPAGGAVPPSPTYQAILGGAATPTSGSVGGLDMQSSICLYLALQQDRNGTKVNVDTALNNREKKIDPTSGQTYIADEWGQPIAFFRWPYGNPEIVNANQSPIPTSSSMQKGNNDPGDPQGLLSGKSFSGQGQFTTLCHPVSNGKSYYGLMPCIGSAGRNAKWGLQYSSPMVWGSMTPDSTNNATDNLYSYRLRQYGRGD